MVAPKRKAAQDPKQSEAREARDAERIFQTLMRAKRPYFSKRHPEAIEQFLKDTGRTRRLALHYLARPFNETTTELLKGDRNLAVAYAQIEEEIGNTVKNYEELAQVLMVARTRLLMALCVREDLRSVQAEAKRRNVSGRQEERAGA